jgi:hypothetical protein
LLKSIVAIGTESFMHTQFPLATKKVFLGVNRRKRGCPFIVVRVIPLYMGFQAVCELCDWKSDEEYLTKDTARVDGERHESEKHDGESCTVIEQKPAA